MPVGFYFFMPRKTQQVKRGFNMITKICLICGKKFSKRLRDSYKQWRERKFCSNKCVGKWDRKFRIGKNHPRWKGGKIKAQGYWWIYQPNHPKAQFQHRYIKQAILVAEKYLGRSLTKNEIIHHIGKKDDDRPQMLYIFSSGSAHKSYEKNRLKERNKIPPIKSNLF